MATGSDTRIVSGGWTVTTVYDTATAQGVTTFTGPNGEVVTHTSNSGVTIQQDFQNAGISPLPSGVIAAGLSTLASARFYANREAAAGAAESAATPVSPVTDPTANAAQTTAVTDSGANATPSEGTVPPLVPGGGSFSGAGSSGSFDPPPTQGTEPLPVPSGDLGEVVVTTSRLPPDEGDDTDSAPDNPDDNTEGEVYSALDQAAMQDATNFQLGRDWRVRLALAPGSNYLYNANPPGILGPLRTTQGVIFPYTPEIQVGYTGSYEASSLTHNNYKIFQYQSSSVDQVTINCPFTAQDSSEALYMLAVIHFFRSATKMFYGQDKDPQLGTPPPLCFLHGLGAFQFDNHPLVISAFTYSLPTDVDYIRVSTTTVQPGVNANGGGFNPSPQQLAALKRMGSTIAPGGTVAPVDFGIPDIGTAPATYVPTMMNMSITCYPIVSRNDISNNFSLRDYATGQLITRGFW
jgi:hypothetical protein